MIKTNFHTHSTYCDGKSTLRELVETAIDKGFTALGFSSHSYMFLDIGKVLCDENIDDYLAEINRLKEEYKGRIKIFAGIEQEYYSPPINRDFDYVIGSVHYVIKNGEYLAVDGDILPILEKYYNGNFDDFAVEYFDLVSDVCEKTKPDIIGHIDLVSKYSERCGFGQSERYLEAAKKAIEKLCKNNVPFEMNTGAMARGFRTTPYPSKEILEMIKTYGGKIVISSDCHNKDFLDCGFDLCEKLAKEVGFTEHGIITENGIEYIKF